MSEIRTLLERKRTELHAPVGSFERLIRRRDRKRRNQRITAGVVGMAVFVAAVWIVTSGWSFDRSQPAVPGPTVPPHPARLGFIGMPPEAAAPSTPERGELVLSLYGRSTTDGGRLFRAWVYDDGRLIWDKEGDFPYGANELTTGLLEQRLTSEGVERLRSEIISTGLFAGDLALISTRGVIWGTVRVRHGDHLVRVNWSDRDIYPEDRDDRAKVATSAQVSALERLDALLTHPMSWLPASAWEDQEIRAYVPSRYAVCYSTAHRAIAPSRILSVLPTPAEDLLGEKDRTFDEFHQDDPNVYCLRVTTEEARSLAGILDDEGLEEDERETAYRLAYLFEPSAQLIPGPIENAVTIYFEPYLPHGEFLLCSPCG